VSNANRLCRFREKALDVAHRADPDQWDRWADSVPGHPPATLVSDVCNALAELSKKDQRDLPMSYRPIMESLSAIASAMQVLANAPLNPDLTHTLLHATWTIREACHAIEDATAKAPPAARDGADHHREGLPDGTRRLNNTERRILAHCRRKAHTGERIAHHVGLSYDHIRRVLARLVREGRLRNTADGYRTV
jgi:hypothetical protein